MLGSLRHAEYQAPMTGSGGEEPRSLVQRGFIFYDGIECGIFIGYMGHYLSVRMGRLVELAGTFNLYGYCLPDFAARLRRFGGVTISDSWTDGLERPMGR